MTTYYNMSIERIVYINGSAHNQLELVDVDPNDIKIEYGNFQDFVRERILKKRCGE